MRARDWVAMLLLVGLVSALGCDDSSGSKPTAARGAVASGSGSAWHSPPPVPPKRPRETTPPHDPYAEVPEDREARTEQAEQQPEVVQNEEPASDEPAFKVIGETVPVTQPPVRTVSNREPVPVPDTGPKLDPTGEYELESFHSRYHASHRETCAAVQFAARSYGVIHKKPPPDLPAFLQFLNEREITLPTLKPGETYAYDNKAGELLIRKPKK